MAITSIEEAIKAVGSEARLIELINYWRRPDRPMLKTQLHILHKDGTIYLECYFASLDEIHWFIDNMSNIVVTPITYTLVDE